MVLLRSNQELLICMAINTLFESLRDCKTCKLDSEKIFSVADKVVQAGPIASSNSLDPFVQLSIAWESI